MLINNPFDDLAVAHTRGRRLRAEAAAERFRGTSRPRRALAETLRRAANRLDPTLVLPPAFLRETVEER
jgi:hypothetical protein